jgi:hypothetical protein
MLAPQMTTSSKAPAGKSPLVRSLLAVIVVVPVRLFQCTGW